MQLRRLSAFMGAAVLLMILSFSRYGSAPALAQGTMPFTENFASFAGTGFASSPGAGQLDSDTWRVTGLQDDPSAVFGGSYSGDFALGVSVGGTSQGGMYAFDVGGGTIALGVQPGSSDFTPGAITLRIQNTTGATITSLDVNYDLYVFNDQGRSNSFNFAYSTDDITYTPVAALDYTSAAVADASPVSWVQNPRSTTINSLSIANGAFFYLQWQSDDVAGSGSRDELGITNISVTSGAAVDTPPTVTSTTPADTATGVAANTNIDIIFNEAVTFGVTSATVTGSTSGAVSATISGSGTSYTLDPTTDFAPGETVTVTLIAANITDLDGTADPLDGDGNGTGGDNYVFSFTVAGGATPVNVVINEISADPDATNGDANGDGAVSTSQDEFVEIVNNSGAPLDVSGWTISDVVSVRHTFPAGTIIANQCAVVVFAGGTPTGAFGGAIVQVASTGQLGLNNGGDSVTLNDGSIDQASYTYGGEGGNNTSLTRSPDITGANPLVQHNTAAGSGGALFSPGTQVNGTNFSGCIVADVPPTVTSTVPTDTATGVSTSTTITINFSETVDIAAGGITLECPTGTPVAFTPITFTGTTSAVITPFATLPDSTACDVTVVAANVTDTDGAIDNMAADYSFSFTTSGPVTVDAIHDIQGTGAAITGAGPFTVRAIVTADFQNSNQLSGFFIQEEDVDADADPLTSEGIFVYCNTCPVAVNVGDLVEVTGNASDYFDMSQITASTAGSIIVVSSGNPLPSATTINVGSGLVSPAGDKNAFYEPFEGMRVTINDTLTVSEYYQLFQYGQIVLFEGGRPYQYTHVDNTPSAGENTTYLDGLTRRRLILDDGSNTQNLPLSIIPQILFYPFPNGLRTGAQGADFFRGGDTITGLTGVLHYNYSEWRIQPTESSYEFTPVNTRPATPPSTGGNIQVASFNVLNYFDGPFPTSRGADSASEFTRQTDKLMQALNLLDADVFGLIEIENDITTLSGLVTSLNAIAGAGTYDYINVGSSVGTDEIMVAFIYKPGVVTPIGAPMIDTDAVHNRPPVAQLFEVTDAGNPDFGEQFIVVVNHFKSKGCGSASGLDTDQGDGQGCYNETRVQQATRLNAWINSTVIPTAGDSDVLIIGDLNAYKGEDPITTLTTAGYTNLTEAFTGANAYSYVFSGQLGYLDHALGSASLTAQVTGVADWHINADEVPVFDYNDAIADAGENWYEEEPDGNNLYEVNAFRTSDHDPVLIGLDLNSTIPVVTNAAEFNGTSLNGATLNVTVDQILVTFNMPVQAGTGADGADNPDNYILLAEGSVAGFQTVDCATGVDAGDTFVPQAPASPVYNAGTQVTTLTFSPALTDGVYRLYICGTTSIVSEANPLIALNDGADTLVNFTIDTTTTPTTPTDPGTGDSGSIAQPDQLGVTQLPDTGETPAWRDDVILLMALAGGAILMSGTWFVLRQRNS